MKFCLDWYSIRSEPIGDGKRIEFNFNRITLQWYLQIDLTYSMMSLNFQDDFLENVDFAAAESKNSAQTESKASDALEAKVKAILFQNVLYTFFVNVFF